MIEAVIVFKNGEVEYIDPVEQVTITNDMYPYDYDPKDIAIIEIREKKEEE